MATVTNISKNSAVAAAGGTVFFGWLFWFTRQLPASGSILTNTARNASPTLTNSTRHTASLINQSKN
jgi:hypothetical protein